MAKYLKTSEEAEAAIRLFFETVGDLEIISEDDPLSKIMNGKIPCEAHRDAIIELVQFEGCRMALNIGFSARKAQVATEMAVGLGLGEKAAELTIAQMHTMIVKQIDFAVLVLLGFKAGQMRGDFNLARLLNTSKAIHESMKGF